MRLFTAVMLPTEVRSHLEQIQRTHLAPRRLSIVRPENLHITLKFLGDIPDTKFRLLREALRSVPVETMTLVADRFEVFPSRGPVRVIAAGVGGDAGKVALLYRQIEEVAAHFDVQRERREFKPHVTLARAREGVPRNSAFESGAPWPGPSFVTARFSLVSSTLSSTGSKYESMETYP